MRNKTYGLGLGERADQKDMERPIKGEVETP